MRSHLLIDWQRVKRGEESGDTDGGYIPHKHWSQGAHMQYLPITEESLQPARTSGTRRKERLYVLYNVKSTSMRWRERGHPSLWTAHKTSPSRSNRHYGLSSGHEKGKKPS